MLNTDIFKFEFVDRLDERTAIDQYLSNFATAPGFSLWLQGKRGTGKSFFLTEYVASRHGIKCVYVNTDINSSSPGAYLKEFIAQLNKVADLKFASYIRANYHSIAAIGQKILTAALSLTELDDNSLAELGVAVTNYFISKHGEKENSVTAVKKYVFEALKKNNNFVFILDNFSQCDSTSLEVLVAAMHEFLGNAHIRVIVCTTDEDLANRFDIKTVLAEKIPNQPLVLRPFNQKQLFARMLERTFDLNETNIKLLSQAFELCQGIPQKFKEILINLYAAQGIAIVNGKAEFVISTFQKILFKREISFDIEALCKEEKYARTILQVIALWGEPIPPGILLDFFEYFANIDNLPILRDEASRALRTLELLHILVRSFDGRISLLRFKHDSLKLAVKEYFKNDFSVPFLHFSIYGYIMKCKDQCDQPYWCQYYQSLRAYHSFAAQVDGWIDNNYNYGLVYFDAGIFNEAEAIFARLEPVTAQLSGEQLLTIAITQYYCGQYRKTDDLLTNIENRGLTKGLSSEQIIKLHIFQARARSCSLDSKGALNAIAQAEKLDVQDQSLRILLMGAKQSILFLSPGGFKQAQDIFDTLINENADIHEMALVYQSAMDYYEGDKAQLLLADGLTIARKFSDHITEAKILNNMAFEHLRCGNYEEANRLYNESISLLAESQPHEQSYPYSNLAVLNMIAGEWEQAISNIVEALFWNKSHYTSLVLKVNRMLCYYHSGNPHWEQIYREFYEYISSQHCVDDKIYKKICINLALIASKEHELFPEAVALLERCRPHLVSEWPHGKYRFLDLYRKVTGIYTELTPPSDYRQIDYYCNIEFEPWLVNFSHD